MGNKNKQKNSKMKFKFLKHTADIKFRAYGNTLNKVFENSALAMYNAVYLGKIKNKIKKSFIVKGKDLESLLYNFLEELLVLFDSQDFIASKINVKIDKTRLLLDCEVIGDKVKNYDVGLTIKAVTYNSMYVKKSKIGYISQVVLDV